MIDCVNLKSFSPSLPSLSVSLSICKSDSILLIFSLSPSISSPFFSLPLILLYLSKSLFNYLYPSGSLSIFLSFHSPGSLSAPLPLSPNYILFVSPPPFLSVSMSWAISPFVSWFFFFSSLRQKVEKQQPYLTAVCNFIRLGHKIQCIYIQYIYSWENVSELSYELWPPTVKICLSGRKVKIIVFCYCSFLNT
jgi:hypothetical protein